MQKIIKDRRSSIHIKKIETMRTKPVAMRSVPMCFNEAFNYFREDWSDSLNVENTYWLSISGKQVLGKLREKKADTINKNMIIFDTKEQWISVEYIANNKLLHAVDYIVYPNSEDKAAKMFY